ncbi:hypothetical protein NC651_039621 [Populus alba x Populus x berolinensis]|nr:hypothetical protein NC651_039621 [Populus alba x Populus x berolinensis]
MFKAQTQKLVTISFCKNPRLVQKDGSTHTAIYRTVMLLSCTLSSRLKTRISSPYY